MFDELNEHIWHPFSRAYAERDADAFLALYSTDLIRAGGPAKEILDYPEFADGMREWFATLAERGSAVSIEFRFHERLVGDSVASERGVFRMTSTRPDGDSRVFYGRFHTFARKTEGRWRIVADHDTPEDATEETFLAGALP